MSMSRNQRASIAGSAAAGVVAGGFGLAVAELVAALSTGWRSPVLDVGDRVIDRVPSPLKDLAIEWFGTNDKIALLVGIGVVLAALAAVAGVTFVRDGRQRVTAGAILAVGAVGAAAAVFGRTGATLGAAVPSIVGAFAAVGALTALDRVAARPESPGPTETDGMQHPPTRRRFLASVAAVGGAAAVVAATGRRIADRFSATESRAAVRLPAPTSAAPALPDGVQAEGAASFVTPNADFYRIDTALTVPQVPTQGWRLRIHGLVDRPVELDFDQLLDRGLIERDITLTCVSNTIGGELVGNARWLGVRLDDLLAEAGVRPEADQIVGRSVDGYTCGFPTDTLDGRDAMVAVGMNGEPLPLAHGFPARLVVPGLYGYVSATKWLQEIELTTFADFDHYWVPRGYAAEAPIKLMSRIDRPRGLDRIPPGPFVIAGVAWAQTIGIEGVEVRIDGGEWIAADLAAWAGPDTWRQWSLPWEATPGRHQLEVRAIDAAGAIQTDERSEPLPDGASGHHTIVVLVDDA